MHVCGTGEGSQRAMTPKTQDLPGLASDLVPEPVEGPGRHGCREWRGQPDLALGLWALALAGWDVAALTCLAWT